MSKAEEGDQDYVRAAVNAIKGAGTLRSLYVAIYGCDPSRSELQQFANRFNSSRSNPGASILGLCVEHLPGLHDMTLAEFFGIKKGRALSGDREVGQ